MGMILKDTNQEIRLQFLKTHLPEIPCFHAPDEGIHFASRNRQTKPWDSHCILLLSSSYIKRVRELFDQIKFLHDIQFFSHIFLSLRRNKFHNRFHIRGKHGNGVRILFQISKTTGWVNRCFFKLLHIIYLIA